MTGKEIIAEIIRDTGCRAEDFYGRDRSPNLVAARKAAAIRLSELGLSQVQIGALMFRDRTSILYYLRPDMHAARAAICAKRWADGKPAREAAAKVRAEARAAAKSDAKAVIMAKRLRAGANGYLPWSDEDTATATKMLAAGAKDIEFRKAVGRSRAAAKGRVREVQAEKRRAANEAKAPSEFSNVPPDVLAEARARTLAPRSLTAWAFGDPAPGFSAYDRRPSALQSVEAGL
jgi:hypothetical protein